MCCAAKKFAGEFLLPIHRRLLAAASLALVLISTAAVAQGGPPAMPVTVAKPLAKRITRWDEYSGRFEAVNTVEVRARVSGFIDKVHFKDGQVVKEGDLLFTLDKRPYQLAVDSAKADVARNQAQVAIRRCRRRARRAAGEVRRDQRSGVRPAQGQPRRRPGAAPVRAGGGEDAELNLEWTEVRAPIGRPHLRPQGGCRQSRRGRPGRLRPRCSPPSSRIDPDPLPVRRLRDPISCAMRASICPAGAASSRDRQNPVRIRLADEDDCRAPGKMDFVDNQLSHALRHAARPRRRR